MRTPLFTAASLAFTALLPACGNSAAPTAQTTASASASASGAPSAVAAAEPALKADLLALAAPCVRVVVPSPAALEHR
jgi:hypothetical protein